MRFKPSRYIIYLFKKVSKHNVRDVLISKCSRTDWEGWNNKWFGIVSSIFLATIWMIMNLWVINFQTNISEINVNFQIISTFVIVLCFIGLAVVDEYLPNNS